MIQVKPSVKLVNLYDPKVEQSQTAFLTSLKFNQEFAKEFANIIMKTIKISLMYFNEVIELAEMQC